LLDAVELLGADVLEDSYAVASADGEALPVPVRADEP